MKRLFFLLGLALTLTANAQQVYTDSIDFSGITGADTVIFPDLGRIRAGSILSIELDITALDTTNAYIQIGGSNTGYTFNNGTTLFTNGTASLDSIQLDPTAIDRIVNGKYQHTSITAVATAQSTKMFVADKILYKYPAIRFIKGSETGKLYFYILKL